MKELDFSKGEGLVPAIVQEVGTKEILMFGFMNQEAWRRTRTDGVVWFYSRTKKRLWMKGETSGNILYVRSIEVDCDRDTLLLHVEAVGCVCHLGERRCFR